MRKQYNLPYQQIQIKNSKDKPTQTNCNDCRVFTVNSIETLSCGSQLTLTDFNDIYIEVEDCVRDHKQHNC